MLKDITDSQILLRTPSRADGADVWELVRNCAPLDENSMYCNLVQCDQFGATCVLAEKEGEVVGWVSGHIRPDDPQTLFVWQVAVSEKARGQGLGLKMLRSLVQRDVCANVTRLQTTITKDNDASWALFEGFANREGDDMASKPHYKSDDHFSGTAKTEHMVTIELSQPQSAAA